MVRTHRRAPMPPATLKPASSYDEAVRAADALRRRGAWDEACRAFHALTVAHPTRSDAFNNLAAILQQTGHPMPALQAVARALELDQQNLPALMNSAEILKDFGDWRTVADTYDAALTLRPHDPAVRFARALHLLTLGQWDEGWREHEQRTHVPDLPLRRTPLTSPAWDGAPLHGRRILLDHEQGLGDQIMFARFATAVQAKGGEVILRCSAPLAPLFATIAGVTEISVEGSPIPPHDVHASLMSLPALLGITDAAGVDAGPYLRPVGECPPAIQEALDTSRPRVGLVWSGNPQHRNDARRSIAPAHLAPLLGTPGVQFVALHRHDAGDPLPEPMGTLTTDLGAQLSTFNDTAHALAGLDLLLSVDTSVAHLAGALGVPTLLMIPFVPDWRWMVDRADTPWYRSVQLLRQTTLFSWDAVIAAASDGVRRVRDAR